MMVRMPMALPNLMFFCLELYNERNSKMFRWIATISLFVCGALIYMQTQDASLAEPCALRGCASSAYFSVSFVSTQAADMPVVTVGFLLFVRWILFH